MFTLWSDIDRLFNHPFADWMFSDRALSRLQEDAFYGAHRMNLMDRGDSLKFVAELPGVDENDMNLSVHEDTLTLSAKRHVQHEKDNTVYLSERDDYDVRRSIALPVRVDAAKAKAAFKNGVLTVDLPKVPESKPQKIAINA